MKIAKTRERRRMPAAMLAAMLGALALAGCSSGNIGDSWQCPLAKGGSCDSVAAADPAVPDAGATRRTLLTEPLWRQRAGEPAEPAAAPCEAECGGGFDPFGWLMRLFPDGDGGGDRPVASQPEAATAAAESETPPGRTVREAGLAGSSAAAEATEPATAALPAEPASAGDDLAQDIPRAGDLRTGEVVARIWIAPFVDVGGVYREASHVRVVLEPAGWRLK